MSVANNPLTPKLRFPEFREDGEWSSRPLRKHCRVNPNVADLPDQFVYIDLDSVKEGVLTAKEKISKAGAPSRAQRLLEHGDIIFQLVRPYQKNNFIFNISDGNDYVASTGYAQLRAKESNQFLYQLVHTNTFVNRVLANCTGSSYPAINSSDLGNIEVEAPPSKAEQQKIADCLGSLDDLLAAHRRKLDALQDHKKGLLQQLFPAEGETTPKLRFPGFEGDWEVDKFERLCIAKISYGIVQAGPHVPTGMPYIKSTDLNSEICLSNLARTSDIIAKKYRRSEVVPDDLVFSLRGNIGAARIVPKEIPVANLTQGTARIRTKGPIKFFHQALQSQSIRTRILAVSKGSTLQEISLEDLRKIQVPHPQESEQQKIANFLGALDALITAQTEQITAVKAHKKGLMQQLFPNLELIKA